VREVGAEEDSFHIIQLLIHHRISLHTHVKLVLSVAEAFQVSLLLWHQNASLSAEAFTTCSNKTIKADA
jgi:hypothetical protein